VSDFGGVLPSTVQELKTIPGIGAYTAGAIASTAFGERAALVDGNVMRVLSRVRAIATNTRNSAAIKWYWMLAEVLVHPTQPGDFNQALMELGACICTPKSPSCHACPIQSVCRCVL